MYPDPGIHIFLLLGRNSPFYKRKRENSKECRRVDKVNSLPRITSDRNERRDPNLDP